jgi:hypothetical protein
MNEHLLSLSLTLHSSLSYVCRHSVYLLFYIPSLSPFSLSHSYSRNSESQNSNKVTANGFFRLCACLCVLNLTYSVYTHTHRCTQQTS